MRRLSLTTAGMLAGLTFSSGASAQDRLVLSDSERSDGASFAEQLRAPPPGQVVLINIFAVPDGEADEFQKGWAKAADALRKQPGFVSTTLHRPVGGSHLWVNHAIWESAPAFATALASPEFRAAAAGMKQPGFRRLYQAEPSLGPTR
jgi:heme-degrading monooxygenase HmoA